MSIIISSYFCFLRDIRYRWQETFTFIFWRNSQSFSTQCSSYCARRKSKSHFFTCIIILWCQWYPGVLQSIILVVMAFL